MKRFIFNLTVIVLTAIMAGSTQTAFTQSGKVQVNDITIAYESFGPEDKEVILLIPGLGTQLTMWHDELCEKLVKRGFRVIRFDLRDSGLSTHLADLGRPDWDAIGQAAALGENPPLPYKLEDMAEDAAGLLRALKIEQAHVVGASMGGAIAQLLTINYPNLVLSLTSIFSDTGNPEMPGPSEQVMAIPPPPPVGSDIEEIIEREIKVWEIIGSPDYPTGEAALREWVIRDTKRNYDPAGAERQAAAITFAGDRREGLRELQIPAVVLHGDADILVPPENGHDTAENIPNAELRIIEGLGHDIPVALINEFADAITSAAERSSE